MKQRRTERLRGPHARWRAAYGGSQPRRPRSRFGYTWLSRSNARSSVCPCFRRAVSSEGPRPPGLGIRDSSSSCSTSSATVLPATGAADSERPQTSPDNLSRDPISASIPVNRSRRFRPIGDAGLPEKGPMVSALAVGTLAERVTQTLLSTTLIASDRVIGPGEDSTTAQPPTNTQLETTSNPSGRSSSGRARRGGGATGRGGPPGGCVQNVYCGRSDAVRRGGAGP